MTIKTGPFKNFGLMKKAERFWPDFYSNRPNTYTQRQMKIFSTVCLTLALLSSPTDAQAGAGDLFNNIKSIYNGFFKINETAQTPTASTLQQTQVSDLIERFSEKNLTIYAGKGILMKAQIEVQELSPEAAFDSKINATSTNGEIRFVWQVKKQGAQNIKQVYRDLVFMELMASNYSTRTSHSESAEGKGLSKIKQFFLEPTMLAELLINAQAGSLKSQYRLLQMEEFIWRNLELRPNLTISDLSPEAFLEIRTEIQTSVDEIGARAVAQNKSQVQALEEWKKNAGVLESYENADEKLNDLVLRNDRAGVRQMLEAYLPWALMEPTEVNSWKLWLEAIEFPDREKSTLVFRGVDFTTDKVQRLKTVGGIENVGFFSTLLTKNQGSYTRRLRSLNNAFRDTNGDRLRANFELRGPSLVTPQLAGFYRAHSVEPLGSTFLSFTSRPEVASTFVGHVEGSDKVNGGLLAVQVDSRRVISNFSSAYPAERELLIPLIIFPDEVVVYEEARFKEPHELNAFVNQVKEKTGLIFTANSTQKVFDAGAKQFVETILAADAFGKACQGVFL